VAKYGILWRNTATANYTTDYPSFPITITFVNTGTTSELLATQSGTNITITTKRVAGASVSTVYQVIEELWAKGLDFTKAREFALVWATSNQAVPDQTIFNPVDGDVISLAASINPNFDWRGMGVGETVWWFDIDDPNFLGRAVVVQDSPMLVEYQDVNPSPIRDVVNNNVDNSGFNGRSMTQSFRVRVGVIGVTWDHYEVNIPDAPYEGFTVDIFMLGTVNHFYVWTNPGVGVVLIDFVANQYDTFRFLFIKGIWTLVTYTTAYSRWTGNIIAPRYLGTGTPAANNILRGDGTWGPVPVLSGKIVAGTGCTITGTGEDGDPIVISVP
jgi:hypothetical protein